MTELPWSDQSHVRIANNSLNVEKISHWVSSQRFLENESAPPFRGADLSAAEQPTKYLPCQVKHCYPENHHQDGKEDETK